MGDIFEKSESITTYCRSALARSFRSPDDEGSGIVELLLQPVAGVHPVGAGLLERELV